MDKKIYLANNRNLLINSANELYFLKKNDIGPNPHKGLFSQNRIYEIHFFTISNQIIRNIALVLGWSVLDWNVIECSLFHSIDIFSNI